MKDFFQWLWAVTQFIPCALLVTIMFVGFYLFCKFTGEPRLTPDNARDNHNYVDHFDS